MDAETAKQEYWCVYDNYMFWGHIKQLEPARLPPFKALNQTQPVHDGLYLGGKQPFL
jgi:hypothetical protein